MSKARNSLKPNSNLNQVNSKTKSGGGKASHRKRKSPGPDAADKSTSSKQPKERAGSSLQEPILQAKKQEELIKMAKTDSSA